ncbi:hypothetical protein ALC53_08075, partial [Atta colombica]
IFTCPMPWNFLTKSEKHHGLQWEDRMIPHSMVKDWLIYSSDDLTIEILDTDYEYIDSLCNLDIINIVRIKLPFSGPSPPYYIEGRKQTPKKTSTSQGSADLRDRDHTREQDSLNDLANFHMRVFFPEIQEGSPNQNDLCASARPINPDHDTAGLHPPYDRLCFHKGTETSIKKGMNIVREQETTSLTPASPPSSLRRDCRLRHESAVPLLSPRREAFALISHWSRVHAMHILAGVLAVAGSVLPANRFPGRES